jgi:serine/threonine protein kinase
MLQTRSGSSRNAEETRTLTFTSEGAVLGTLQYMAPEQLQGSQTDARSDIFAFGLIVYEMLTGRRPYEGRNCLERLAQILDRITPSITHPRNASVQSLNAAMQRCLRVKAKDRWQSTEELVQTLARIPVGAKAAILSAAVAELRGSSLSWRLLKWLGSLLLITVFS